MMRLFLAIEIPSDVLAALEEEIAPLRAEFPDLAWVPPANRHLTLKFLGEVGDDRVSAIEDVISQTAARHRPFAMHLGGVGAFPNFRRARVLWLGVEQEARLELLHHDVEVAMDGIGFEVEGRAFRPHITVARIRDRMDVDDTKKLSRAAKRIDFSTSVSVEEITVFESTLAQGGSHYRRVHMATLVGGR